MELKTIRQSESDGLTNPMMYVEIVKYSTCQRFCYQTWNIYRKTTTTVAPLPISGQDHQLPNIKLKIYLYHRIKNLKSKKRTSMRIKDNKGRMMPRKHQIPQTEFQLTITSKCMDIMICLILSMFTLLRNS